MSLRVVVLLPLLAVVPLEPKLPSVAEERKQLAGDWVLLRSYRDGDPYVWGGAVWHVPPNEADDTVISNPRIDDWQILGRLKLMPYGRTRREYEHKVLKGSDDAGITWVGIYRLEGDILTIAEVPTWESPADVSPPHDFSGEGCFMHVYRRKR